jgi:hypothetical protein
VRVSGDEQGGEEERQGADDGGGLHACSLSLALVVCSEVDHDPFHLRAWRVAGNHAALHCAL